MKTIYFLRHSIRDTTVHHEQAPLTTEGQLLAQAISRSFLDKNITQIYSSPFQRTLDTVQPTAEKLGLPIQKLDWFQERKVGAWLADFDTFAQKQWYDFDYKEINGESLNDVKKRILPPFKNLLKGFDEKTLICGHGTALSVLFHELTTGAFHYQDFKEMAMPDLYELTFQKETLVQFKKVPL